MGGLCRRLAWESWKLCWCDGMGDTNIGWEEGCLMLLLFRDQEVKTVCYKRNAINNLSVLHNPTTNVVSHIEA